MRGQGQLTLEADLLDLVGPDHVGQLVAREEVVEGVVAEEVRRASSRVVHEAMVGCQFVLVHLAVQP